MLEKIAFKIIKKTEEIGEAELKQQIPKIIINSQNFQDFLGQKIFDDFEIYDDLQPGVVKGLAYSGYGGSVLYIESSLAGKK